MADIGFYRISFVTISNGENLQGSPFVVYVDTVTVANLTTAEGDGLAERP